MRILIVLLLLCSLPLEAEETKLVLHTEHWLPYNYLDETGNIVGTSTASVKSLLEKAGLSYRIEMMNWARSFQMAKQLPNHAIFTIFRTKEREPYFHWFCPITEEEPIHIFRLAESTAIQIKSKDDFARYTFGVNRNDWMHNYLKELGLIEGKQLDISSAQENNIAKLLAGRVQLVINTLPGMEETMKNRDLPMSKLASVWVFKASDTLPLCLAVNKDSDPEIVAKITRAFTH